MLATIPPIVFSKVTRDIDLFVGVGSIANSVLTTSVLAGLPGLSVVAFLPATLIGIAALVTAIAFLAGTIPALNAARQDPIESLRYE